MPSVGSEAFGRVRRFGCLDLRPNLRSSVNSAFGRSLLLYVAGGEAEAQVAQGHWQDRQGEKRGQVGGVGEEVVLSGEGGCAG